MLLRRSTPPEGPEEADRRAEPWRRPFVGHVIALLSQGVAIGLTLLIVQALPTFAFRGLLPVLAVAVVALTWGVGPSLSATLAGAILLNVVILPPYSAASRASAAIAETLLFLSVALAVGALAGHAERARRSAREAMARQAQLYAAERVQRERAEQAVRLRDDILSLATHDLRSPLATVLGYAQLVQRRVQRNEHLDPAWLDAQMQTIGTAVGRLNTTIEEISDVARLQIGQALDLQRQEVDLVTLVRAVAAEECSGAPERSPVDVHVPDEGEILVDGDRMRLARVLHNIIGNAVKYSPQGAPVCIEVEAQGPWATIIVCDQGVGIPADELPHLFTRYFRASTAQGIKGSGIGLAGSKAIVEQHGGEIAVSSTVGQGTTVTVHLPRTSQD